MRILQDFDAGIVKEAAAAVKAATLKFASDQNAFLRWVFSSDDKNAEKRSKKQRTDVKFTARTNNKLLPSY